MTRSPWETEPGFDLAAGAVRSLRDRRFPDHAGSAIELLAEGWDATAWRFVTRGEPQVLRVPRRALGAAALAAELRWLPALRGDLPLPTPDPIAGPADAAFPHPVALHRMLPGDGGAAPVHRRAAVALGDFLAALHGLSRPEDAPVDALHRADRRRRLPALLARIAALPGSPRRRAAIAALLDRLAEAPAHPGPAAWVHGDLHPRHVLLDGAGAVVGVIDWGDLHVGDPALDLAIAWTLPIAAEDRAALLAAYDAGRGGTTRVDDPGLRHRAWFRAIHYAAILGAQGRSVGDAPLVALSERVLAEAENAA